MQQDHLERSSLLSVEISICIAGRMKINIKKEKKMGCDAMVMVSIVCWIRHSLPSLNFFLTFYCIFVYFVSVWWSEAATVVCCCCCCCCVEFESSAHCGCLGTPPMLPGAHRPRLLFQHTARCECVCTPITPYRAVRPRRWRRRIKHSFPSHLWTIQISCL